jgi:hypothetical protein
VELRIFPCYRMDREAHTLGSSANNLPPRAKKENHGTARHSASNRPGSAT